MKKAKFLVMAVLVMVGTISSSAQNARQKRQGGYQQKKPTISDKAQNVWENTKQGVSNVATNIKDRLGIEDSDAHLQLRVRYMPIYTSDKYKGTDSEELKQACREKFLAKYPHTAIDKCVIPLEDWDNLAVVSQTEKVKGYIQTLRVYILAKDGNDGYINAEFEYQRYKEIGGIYNAAPEKWPLWSRTDVLPKEIYKMLK